MRFEQGSLVHDQGDLIKFKSFAISFSPALTDLHQLHQLLLHSLIHSLKNPKETPLITPVNQLCMSNLFTLACFQALVLQQKGNLMELVDPRLGSDFTKEEANKMVKVALLCTNPSPALRPTMSTVVSMLEGRSVVHELIMDPSLYGDETRLTALTDRFEKLVAEDSLSIGTQSFLQASDATWIGDSATATSSNLYQDRHECYLTLDFSNTYSKHNFT